jgi:flagellar basal-body rod modification protein FlgD
MPLSINSTNPTASAVAAQDSSKLTENYETFLNLLTAQLRNQDPLSPLDTAQWTSQLVQYSSVEQSIKANSYLEKIASSTGDTIASAANYIGKTVTADQAQANLNGGKASWDYSLEANAKDVNLTVTDANGVVVYSEAGTDVTAGSHSFEWDGKGSNGQSVPEGQYTLSINATDANGNAISNTVSIRGSVTSVQQTDNGLELTVNNTPVLLRTVKSVS